MAKKKKRGASPAKKTARKTVSKKPVRTKAKSKPTSAESDAKWGGISSAAVERATGSSWEKWIKALDLAGCATMSHAQIAAIAGTKFGADDWWAQMVTVGYEQARGLRKPNQKSNGFSASASRTFAASGVALTDAFVTPAKRAKWLAGAPLEVRTVRKGRSVRGAWGGENLSPTRGMFRPEGLGQDGASIIAAWITSKGPMKASIAVQHERLKNEADVAKAKAFWSAALDRLGDIL